MLSEERKVVTVLFCDLVDFTASSDDADPEDVRARLRPYHERVRAEIEGYGGTVEKFIGDAVMAVFGAPIAHEDDAERAVRAGLRILEAIEDLNEADPDLGLRVRIGIATGEAVVSLAARPEHGEGIVTGDVVNVASRLQGVAPPGGVVVGEQTYRATQAFFDYAALDPVEVKGKSAAIPIWQPTAARSRFGADIARSHATPLVGRQLEQRIVVDGFERAVEARTPQLVTIVGEPGVGKSRLVSELFAHIESVPDPVRWRQGRCLPYGEGVTFWALGEIVKAEAGILETDAPDVAVDKLDATIPTGEDREWLRQRLLPLVGVEAAAAEREEQFTAWRRYLEALADARPSVFVFEDLHWADEAMLAFLAHLADWAEGVPMLVVGTARPELFERYPTWASGARNATRINLAPLSESETAELVALLLEQAVLPAEVQSLVLDRAGGNPLYAEEFVRLLRDRGLLAGQGKVVGLVAGAEIAFPESVQALIAARLDTLDAGRKALLHDAAVIGKVFWAGAVAAMGEREPAAVREALHELSRKELVRPARVSSMQGETEYSFWHVLVRDVAYGQIPRAARADRHRRAADWIGSEAGERIEDHAEILAHHYLTALELATAAGDRDTHALRTSAMRFLLLAAERALALDVTQAERQLSRALELAPPGDPQRPAILVRWGDAVRQAGRHAEAATALREAIGLYERAGDGIHAAQAMTTLSNVQWQLGDPAGRETSRHAVHVLERLPPGPELVDALGEVAAEQHLAGEYRESIASATRALEIAERLGLDEPSKPLEYLGASQFTLGDATGLEAMRRAAALAVERGEGRDAGIFMNNHADATSSVEGPVAGLALYQQAIEFARRRGSSELSDWMSVEAAGQMIRAGRFEDAMATLRAALEAFAGAGRMNGLARCQAEMAIVLAYRGDIEEALPLIDDALEAAETLTAIESVILALQGGALVHAAKGDSHRVRALLALLARDRARLESSTFSFFFPDAMRAAIAADDIAVGERLLNALPDVLPDQKHARAGGSAILAEGRGELAEAARLYGEAAAGWEGFGVPTERAFALLGQGRSLIALGRQAEAVAPLTEARELFMSMGGQPGRREAEALLGRTAALAS